jgi:nucleotide sugar dehydrogenase
LGNIGLSVARHVEQIKRYIVFGYDISEKAVIRAEKYGIASSTTWIPDADIYVVAVNTWFKNGNPDMSAIEDVCSKIHNDALVCIESTLSVGTARTLSEKYGLKYIVVCPHRWWQGDQKKYGVVQTRVLGALNKESFNRGTAFYQSLNIPFRVVSSLEVAELVKVTENANRFVEIAFAESLFMTCKKHDIPFEEIRCECNTLKRDDYRVQILEARQGIGGECLPKDVRYLLSLMNSSILEGAIEVDDLFKKDRGNHK